eukprot:gene1343-1465_t
MAEDETERPASTSTSTSTPTPTLKRSAEKERPVSSCKWADRVASLSIETFRQLCPEDLVYQQTVLATVLMRIEEQDLEEEDEGGACSGGGGGRVRLHVVGLGVGTKTLSASKMQSDSDSDSDGSSHPGGGGGGGDGYLRDMHAEKWAKAKRVVERVELSEDDLPDLPHPTFWPTATTEGEVMPLVKWLGQCDDVQRQDRLVECSGYTRCTAVFASTRASLSVLSHDWPEVQ